MRNIWRGKAQPSALGDYYLKDGERIEAPGRWVSGARTVGCDSTGSVTGEQLRLLLAVRRPDTSETLRAAGAGGETVAALDATFSAPKSVSGVGDRRPRAARTDRSRARDRDRPRPYLRRPAGANDPSADRPTNHRACQDAGLVATSWRHTTARAVADQAPDPQLHSHVVLHAAVRRDGKVVAIDSRKWPVVQPPRPGPGRDR